LRVDVNITDKFSAWVLGAYQSDFDSNSFYTGESNWFGQWQGDWAVWAVLLPKFPTKQSSMVRQRTKTKAHTLLLLT